MAFLRKQFTAVPPEMYMNNGCGERNPQQAFREDPVHKKLVDLVTNLNCRK